MLSKHFKFGLEAEFLLVDNKTFKPYSHLDLDFAHLLKLVDSIDTSDCSCEGFNLKPLHNKITPYLIEGYTHTDEAMRPLSLAPKGIEIRTPLSDTLHGSTEHLREYFLRLEKRLCEDGMSAASLSYHPSAPRIVAKQNYKRMDYWQWALSATTTYGPDINISLPDNLSRGLDIERINARVNFYGPAAVALTLASPLREGKIFHVDGREVKSARTFERSQWAPIFYVHDDPNLRFEFKGFEMSRNLQDYHAMFLIGLALLLDDDLSDVESDTARVAALRGIAVDGLEYSTARSRAEEVLLSAEKIARQYEFERTSLDTFWNRLASAILPADAIAQTFKQTGSVEHTLSKLIGFDFENSANQLARVNPGAVSSAGANMAQSLCSV